MQEERGASLITITAANSYCHLHGANEDIVAAEGIPPQGRREFREIRARKRVMAKVIPEAMDVDMIRADHNTNDAIMPTKVWANSMSTTSVATTMFDEDAISLIKSDLDADRYGWEGKAPARTSIESVISQNTVTSLPEAMKEKTSFLWRMLIGGAKCR